MNNTDSDILETQLLLGKKLLEVLIDLVSDDHKEGAVVPLDMNGRKFTLKLEKS